MHIHNIHNIHYNTYILNALKDINYNNNIIKLLYYCFNNIKIGTLKILAKKIKKAISINSLDYQFIKTIVTWMNNLKSSDYVKFKLSYSEYIDLKVDESINYIKSDKRLINNTYLDIGSGDCALTYKIGKKLNMKSFAVDIDTEIDWSGDSSKSCSGRKILYDGTNIKDVKKKILKQFGSEYKEHKFILGLCSYNHSIHHFGSYYNIENSIKQVSKLLKPNGYILFREHNISKDNFAMNININLQHIILFIKYTYDKKKGLDYFINLYNKYIFEYTSNYFSSKWLENICYKYNLKLIYKKKRIIPEPINKTELIKNGINPNIDISRTYIYIFQKKNKHTQKYKKHKKYKITKRSH